MKTASLSSFNHKRKTVDLYISEKPSQHILQIITGFRMLKKQALIHLNININNQFKTPSEHIIIAVIGNQKIAFDVLGEFYQFNLSSCIRQQNSLTAQFVSFSLSNLANIFYPPQFLQ